jgi:hypothetical protein
MVKTVQRMQFKLGIFLMALSLIPSAHAAEIEVLPMELMELLGELEEDDLESLDDESLNATLHDAKASTNKRANEPKQTNEIRRTNEVGGQ